MSMDFSQLQEQASEYLKQERFTEAIALYEEIIAANPTVMSSYWQLGLAQFLNGEEAEAQAIWMWAIAQGDSEEINLWTTELLQILQSKAIYYHSIGKTQIAEKLYRVILEQNPDHALVLNNLGGILRDEGNLDEALPAFQKAISCNPNLVEAYHNLGKTYKQLGKLSLSIQNFKKALEINPDYKQAYLAICDVYQENIPDWHFSMMNDHARNIAYQEAIEKAVAKNPSFVLEIGTGSGLLSMIAARAGAKQVITCEFVELVAEKAQEIIKLNHLDDKIKVINKLSTALKVGEDIPEKADILVSEIFGADLLGEGALQSLNHAFEYLVKPEAQIIPQGAAIYIMLIHSQEIYNRCTVQQACGFDLSPFNEFSNLLIRPLLLNVYEYEQVSEVQKANRISFTKDHLNITETIVELEIIKEGKFNAIACWFDLFLDEEIILTNSPLRSMEEQGVSWGQRIQVLDQEIAVTSGDKVRVKLKNEGGKLLFFEIV